MKYHFLNGEKLNRARAAVKAEGKDPLDEENICLVVAQYEKLAGVYKTTEDPKPEPKLEPKPKKVVAKGKKK